MKCINPLLISRPRIGQLTIPCGVCFACRVNRTQEWAIRILHECQLHEYNTFLTLTYDGYSCPHDFSLDKRDLQKYFKRLRKIKPLRYFASGEYGDEYDRPHYHAVIFGWHFQKDRDILSHVWGKGTVTTSQVTDTRAKYTAKYIQKKLFGAYAGFYEAEEINPEFALQSRKPAIGLEYAKNFIDSWSKNGFLIYKGIKYPIPRVYLSFMPEDKRQLHKDILAEKRSVIESQKRLEGRRDSFQIESKESRKQREVDYEISLAMNTGNRYEILNRKLKKLKERF